MGQGRASLKCSWGASLGHQPSPEGSWQVSAKPPELPLPQAADWGVGVGRRVQDGRLPAGPCSSHGRCGRRDGWKS